MTASSGITPLFIITTATANVGKDLIAFTNDNYNKELGAALIDAKNDAEAISTFLREYHESPETLRSYAKEIERLLLWCIHIAKVNISSLRRNHLLDYQAFLINPMPKKRWCGPSTARLKPDGSINPDWRPFVRGLGTSSVKKSIKILDSFFNYLVQTNYLIGNPLAVDRRRKKRQQLSRMIDRYLELDEIEAVLNGLAQYPLVENQPQKAFQVIRARYIVLLLFYTGLRIAEAANHTMGHFMQREGNWFLRVMGKGKKIREIPVPDELLQALSAFRLQVGLPTAEPQYKEKTPLIPMQNLSTSITPRRIDQILKWAFQLGAQLLPFSQPLLLAPMRYLEAVCFFIAGVSSVFAALLKSNSEVPLALAYIGLIALCLVINFFDAKRNRVNIKPQ